MSARVFHHKKRIVIDNITIFTETKKLHWHKLGFLEQAYSAHLVTPVGTILIYIELEDGNKPRLVISKDSWENIIYVSKCKCVGELLNTVYLAIEEDTPSARPDPDSIFQENLDQALSMLEIYRRLSAR